MKFKAKIDVVESMGSELYAYFDVETKGEVQSDELADLAKDAGPRGPAERRRASTWSRAWTPTQQGGGRAARSSSCSTRRRSSCSTPTAAGA